MLRHVFRFDDMRRVAELAGNAQFAVLLEGFVQLRFAERGRRRDHVFLRATAFELRRNGMFHGESRLLHNAVGKIFDDDFEEVVRYDRRCQKLLAFIRFQLLADLLENGEIATGQSL